MELLDYLKWRNDVPLSVSPLNRVDNIILAYPFCSRYNNSKL